MISTARNEHGFILFFTLIMLLIMQGFLLSILKMDVVSTRLNTTIQHTATISRT